MIDFSGYSIPNLGEQNVKVTATALGDENLLNNTYTKLQKVTNGVVQLGEDDNNVNSGVGFNSAGSELVAKMLGSGTRKIPQIKLPFNSDRQTVTLKILDENGTANGPGTVLFTAGARLTSSDNKTIYVFTTPITVTGDYFISVKQNNDTSKSWQYDIQYPQQLNRVYTGNGIDYALSAIDRPFLPKIKVVEQNVTLYVGVIAIVNLACGYGIAEAVSVAVSNNSSTILDFAVNPITIGGTITNLKTNISVPFSVLQNTGTLLAGQYLIVPTGITYDMSD